MSENKEEFSFVDQLWGFVKGAGNGAIEGVIGTYDLTTDLLGTSWYLTGGWYFNPEKAHQRWDSTKAFANQTGDFVSDVWYVTGGQVTNPQKANKAEENFGKRFDALAAPYRKDWEEGNYGEAIGRGAVELFGTKGIGKVAKAGSNLELPSVLQRSPAKVAAREQKRSIEYGNVDKLSNKDVSNVTVLQLSPIPSDKPDGNWFRIVSNQEELEKIKTGTARDFSELVQISPGYNPDAPWHGTYKTNAKVFNYDGLLASGKALENQQYGPGGGNQVYILNKHLKNLSPQGSFELTDNLADHKIIDNRNKIETEKAKIEEDIRNINRKLSAFDTTIKTGVVYDRLNHDDEDSFLEQTTTETIVYQNPENLADSQTAKWATRSITLEDGTVVEVKVDIETEEMLGILDKVEQTIQDHGFLNTHPTLDTPLQDRSSIQDQENQQTPIIPEESKKDPDKQSYDTTNPATTDVSVANLEQITTENIISPNPEELADSQTAKWEIRHILKNGKLVQAKVDIDSEEILEILDQTDPTTPNSVTPALQVHSTPTTESDTTENNQTPEAATTLETAYKIMPNGRLLEVTTDTRDNIQAEGDIVNAIDQDTPTIMDHQGQGVAVDELISIPFSDFNSSLTNSYPSENQSQTQEPVEQQADQAVEPNYSYKILPNGLLVPNVPDFPDVSDTNDHSQIEQTVDSLYSDAEVNGNSLLTQETSTNSSHYNTQSPSDIDAAWDEIMAKLESDPEVPPPISEMNWEHSDPFSAIFNSSDQYDDPSADPLAQGLNELNFDHSSGIQQPSFAPVEDNSSFNDPKDSLEALINESFERVEERIKQEEQAASGSGFYSSDPYDSNFDEHIPVSTIDETSTYETPTYDEPTSYESSYDYGNYNDV
ncbi:hypothetical protein [Moorena sp. SIO3B2]|uniref:hypothetical protein n=1 Tax=Moorena sp. SIO3B2 TaxID=2607827 RepID=UPI0013CAC49D|nr:hypothetical protein [Moorena sp. SIO3B2]NEP35054.1 hypothetical protein [Moorena sp. SIO3B2]